MKKQVAWFNTFLKEHNGKGVFLSWLLWTKKGDVQFVQAGMLPEASLEELIKQLDKAK